MSECRAKWLEASPRGNHGRELGRDNQEDEAEDLWECMAQIHPHTLEAGYRLGQHRTEQMASELT